MCACPRSPRTYGAVSEVGAWGRPDGPCHLLGGAPPPGSLGLMGWCGVACGRACLPGGRGRSADRPRPRDPSFLCLQSADCTTRLVGTRCLSSVLWGFLGCDLEPGSRPGRAGRGREAWSARPCACLAVVAPPCFLAVPCPVSVARERRCVVLWLTVAAAAAARVRCGASRPPALPLAVAARASVPRLPWPGPLGGFRFQFDRCGDLALSRAGPKPRRTRDGHSWRMRPLFSLPLAGPSLLPAASVVVRGRGGGRNPARPRGPASASRGDGGARGLVDAADPLRLAPRPPPWRVCLRGGPHPGRGRAVLLPRRAPSRWARGRGPHGSPWCFWGAPGRLLGARGRDGVVVSRSPAETHAPGRRCGGLLRWLASRAGDRGGGREERGTPALLAWRGWGVPAVGPCRVRRGAGQRWAFAAGAGPALAGCWLGTECRRVLF